jgi:hypothetical protein
MSPELMVWPALPETEVADKSFVLFATMFSCFQKFWLLMFPFLQCFISQAISKSIIDITSTLPRLKVLAIGPVHSNLCCL